MQMLRLTLSLITFFLLNTSYISASELEGRGYSRGNINWAEACGGAVYEYVTDLASGLGYDESYRRFIHKYLTDLREKNAFNFDKEYQKMTESYFQSGFEEGILFPAYEAYQCTGFDKFALSLMAARHTFEKLCFYHGYSRKYSVPTDWALLPC